MTKETTSSISRAWTPLAMSWLFMSLEFPLISAVISRMAFPQINLAAFGSIVFPLAMMIEAPVIMLLAASTALCKDAQSYRKVRAFMLKSGAGLTILHGLIAFTPLFDVVVFGILGAPPELGPPARTAMMVMTPWTWSIGWRRFNQGLIIRAGRTLHITIGTILRLATNLAVLLTGFNLNTYSGSFVAAAATVSGVFAEALYIAIVSRPVILNRILPAPSSQPLDSRAFFDFYLPLVLTSFLTLASQPIGTAALARMPEALDSLAVWPVVSSFMFFVRSMGMALNEVVVAKMESPGSLEAIFKFARWAAGISTAVLILLAGTPLALLLFQHVLGLKPVLADLASKVIWLGLPMPVIGFYQSIYSGALTHGRKTRHITESVAILLLLSATIFWVGAWLGIVAGVYVTLAGFTIARLAQTEWLRKKSLPLIIAVNPNHPHRRRLSTFKTEGPIP